MLKSSCEVYQEALSKFLDLQEEIKRHLAIGAYDEAWNHVQLLTAYRYCYYCQTYRLDLNPITKPGICTICPLHKHGQRLAGHTLLYNGCYRIGVYRNLVKTSTWYEHERSEESLRAVLVALEEATKYLVSIRPEITENDVYAET